MIIKTNHMRLGWDPSTLPPGLLSYWDRDLVCRFANATCAEFLGYPAHEMVGWVNLADMLSGQMKDDPYIQGCYGEKCSFW